MDSRFRGNDDLGEARKAQSMEKCGYVYMLASERHGTLYVGVSSDLVRRVWQHKDGEIPGFTARYGVKLLVWFEGYEQIETAIAREKAIKKWRRAWKIEIIESTNPDWRDLYPGIIS